MKKNKLKIGDVAKQLGIKKSIIRQWEQEFGLKQNDPAQENNRYYTSEDVTLFTTIKELLRTKGLSISDAKAHLTTIPAVKYVELQAEKKSEEPVPEMIAATPTEEPTIDASPLDSTPEIVEPSLDASPVQEEMASLQESAEEKSCAALEEKKEEAFQAPSILVEAIAHAPVETVVQEHKEEETILAKKLEEATQKLETASLQPAEIVHDLELHLAQLKERLLDFKKLLS